MRIYCQETEPGDETFGLIVGKRVIPSVAAEGKDAAPDRG